MTGKRARQARKRAAPASAHEEQSEALLQLDQRSLALPVEVLMAIFARVIDQDQRTGVRLLLLNTHLRQALIPLVYRRVELYTSCALAKFAQLLTEQAEPARHVRYLWIGPRDTRSDLLSALSLPTPGDSYLLEDMRRQVYTDTRFVLRACRRLTDVALSGSLVSTEVVNSYGTACQPVRLTSINPHSFISGFSAPIFRKVRELTVCDINLSQQEAEEIRKLSELRTLRLICPKDYGDMMRDVRILQHAVTRGAVSLEESFAYLSMVSDLQNAAPLKPLELLEIRTAERRAASLADAMRTPADGAPLAVAHRALPPTFVDEWEALRDLLFNAEEYSRAAFDDDVGGWLDPGHPLAELLHEWRASTPSVPTPLA